MLVTYQRRQPMDDSDSRAADSAVQAYDAEVARLAARIEQLRDELSQAEAELRHTREREMAARRAAITGEPMHEPSPDA
jgi:uncharacterized protein YukE